MLAMTYDATTKIFNGYVEVDDEKNVPANATLVKPDGIVQPYTWDGTKWMGMSVEDYEEKYPSGNNEESDQPTTEQALATLTLQVAQNKADQDAVNAQLLLATAQQTAKETN